MHKIYASGTILYRGSTLLAVLIVQPLILMITESPFPIKGHSKLVFRFVFLSDASTHSHLPLLFQAFPATPFSVQFHNPTGLLNTFFI